MYLASRVQPSVARASKRSVACFQVGKPLRQIAKQESANPKQRAASRSYELPAQYMGANPRQQGPSLPCQRRGITVCDDGNLAVNIRKRCQSANLRTPVFELTTCNRRNSAVIEHERWCCAGPCEFSGLRQHGAAKHKGQRVTLRCQGAANWRGNVHLTPIHPAVYATRA